MRPPRAKWRRFAPLEKDPKRAEYLIPADPSLGTGFDPAAAHVLRLDLTQLDPMNRTGPLIIQDAVLYDQIEPDLFAVLLHEASEHHRKGRIACEDNGIGIAVVSSLARLRSKQVLRRQYDQLTRRTNLKPGWHTDTASKPAMLSTLRRAISQGLVEVNDLDTAKDLGHIHIKGKKDSDGIEYDFQPMTAKGQTDHLVMALAIGVHILLTEHIKAWSGTHQGEKKATVTPLHRFRRPNPILSTWDIKPGRERWG